MKKDNSWISFKFKTSVQAMTNRQWQKNEKTNHRLGVNICKTHVTKDCFPKYTEKPF